MEPNTSLDMTETTIPGEPPTATVATPTLEPPGKPGPPRSKRIWWLTGLLAVMSVAAVVENIIFHEPNLVGTIALKKGDSGPAGLFKKDAPLGPDGKAPAKGRDRGMRKGITPESVAEKLKRDAEAVDAPPPPVFDSRTPEEKKADEEKATLEKKAAEEKKATEAKKATQAPATGKVAEPKPADSPAPSPKE
jgi:hypothetical protein